MRLLRLWNRCPPSCSTEGDINRGCFLAGQIAAMVTKEQPAAEIITEIMEEAEKVLRSAGKW
jgi:enoyl-[acyl-carrier protein] reductase II